MISFLHTNRISSKLNTPELKKCVDIVSIHRYNNQRSRKKSFYEYVPLAQLVEQLTLNQWAQGSSP